MQPDIKDGSSTIKDGSSMPEISTAEPNIDIHRRPTFRQKGTTYVIKNTGVDIQDNEDIYHVIDDLYEDVMNQASMADFQANLYKLIYVFASIFIVIAGAVSGILAINVNTVDKISNATASNTGSILTITVLGFSITVMKTLLVLFTIEKRSVLLKESAIKLRKLGREIKNLKNQNMTNLELFQRIDMIHTEVDELAIHMFKNDTESTKPQNNTDTVVNL